jgi:putative methionine-R-sulfoxide reductase with GAF domain
MTSTLEPATSPVSRFRALRVLFTDPSSRQQNPEQTSSYLTDIFSDEGAFKRHLVTLADLLRDIDPNRLPHKALTEDQQQQIIQNGMDFSGLSPDELHRLLFDYAVLKRLKRCQASTTPPEVGPDQTANLAVDPPAVSEQALRASPAELTVPEAIHISAATQERGSRRVGGDSVGLRESLFQAKEQAFTVARSLENCLEALQSHHGQVLPAEAEMPGKAFDPAAVCEQARRELGAASVIPYVANPFVPDDFRIVCMPGVALHEVMHGSVGLPSESSKRLITEGDPEVFLPELCEDDGLDPELAAIIEQHAEANRRLFANFVQREGIRARARLAHRVNGRTLLALFVNFARPTPFDEQKKGIIRRLFQRLVENLEGMEERLKEVNPALAQQIVRIWETSGQLTELGLEGQGGRSLQECLNSILDVSLDAFEIRGSGFATIHLYDRETRTLRLGAFRGHIDRPDDAWAQSVRDTDRPGVVTVVALKGKAILIGDLAASPYGRIHRCIRDGTRSELAVPMLANGVVVGVINLESTQANAFTSESVRVLWNAANKGAVAVLLDRQKKADRERALLKDRLYQLQNRLLQFHTRSMSGQPDDRSPLDELATIACDTLGASLCDLWHYDPRTDDFGKAGFSQPSRRAHESGPRSKGKQGWSHYLRRTRWPVWITHVKADDVFDALYWDPQRLAWQTAPPATDPPETISPYLQVLGVQCELGIPIVVDDRCLGVAWLKYKDIVQEPSPEDVEKMAGFMGNALVLYRNGKGPLYIPSQTRMSLADEFTGKVAELMKSLGNVG